MAYKSLTYVYIIVLTYNQEKYIIDTLRSLKSQTYKKLRVLISDDCSTDSTYIEVLSFVKNEAPFFECRQNSTNLGLAKHLNLVISEVDSAELVGLCSGDDVSCPNRVDKIVANWNMHGRPSIIGSFVNEISISGRSIREERFQVQNFDLFSKIGCESELNYLVRLSPILALGATNFYRGDFIKAHKLPENFPYEDHFYYFHAIRSFKTLVLEEPLLNYRIHPTSLSHSNTETPLIINLYGFTKNMAKSISVAKKENVMLLYYLKYILLHDRLCIRSILTCMPILLNFLLNIRLVFKIKLFYLCQKIFDWDRFFDSLYHLISYNLLSFHVKRFVVLRYLQSVRLNLNNSHILIIGSNLNGKILFKLFKKMMKETSRQVYLIPESDLVLINLLRSNEISLGDEIAVVCSSLRAEKVIEEVRAVLSGYKQLSQVPRGITNRIFRLIF